MKEHAGFLQVPVHLIAGLSFGMVALWMALPSCGFDGLWQLAVCPRPARPGVLTFVPTDARSKILPLDIEFTKWAHPRNEVVNFPTGDGCC